MEKEVIVQIVFSFHSKNGVYIIKKELLDKFPGGTLSR